MADIYLNIISSAKSFSDAQKMAREQMDKTEKKNNDTNKKMQNEFNKSGEVIRKVGGYIAAMFTIGAAVQFVKKIIEVRSEFEKYAAVLKNTLGSELQAAKAMGQLQQFAAQTPFSVRQLTDSFVKLANQGFKPTIDEMRKLGDVAASTGKSFDQLAEALIDAQVGEFERLKEFGIRAQKEGDRVTFTFKEVKTQVDFTADSIRQYILGLGDAVGVSGAMDEISKTLGGRISNLGDSWETLLDTLGGRTSGIFAGVIQGLQQITDGIDKVIKTAPEFRAGSRLQAFISEIEELDKVAKQTAIDKFIKELTEDLDEYNNMNIIQRKLNKENIETTELLIKQLQHYNDEIVNGTYNTDSSNDATEKYYKTLTDLKEELAKLIKTKESINIEDKESIKNINLQIIALQKQIKEIENLGIILQQTKIKDYLNDIANIKIEDTLFDEENISSIEEMINNADNILADFVDKELERQDELTDNQIRQDQLIKQAKEQTYYELANTALYYTDLIAAKNQNAMNQELAALDSKYKKQLISEEAYQKQSDAIKRKYAREDQEIAVNQSLISGALAIMKTFAQYGYTPIAIGLAALMGIQTALQIANIKAQEFSTGVLKLKGKGSETSDSIPAWLSQGESVMTARETREYYPYLKAMKDGKFPKLQLDLMSDFAKLKMVTNNNLNYDNSKELKELRQIQEILKRKGELQYTEGGQRVIRKGNVTTRININ